MQTLGRQGRDQQAVRKMQGKEQEQQPQQQLESSQQFQPQPQFQPQNRSNVVGSPDFFAAAVGDEPRQSQHSHQPTKNLLEAAPTTSKGGQAGQVPVLPPARGDGASKRGRGRPRMQQGEEQLFQEPQAKRGRGRPRMHQHDEHQVKRGPGRPRKRNQSQDLIMEAVEDKELQLQQQELQQEQQQPAVPEVEPQQKSPAEMNLPEEKFLARKQEQDAAVSSSEDSEDDGAPGRPQQLQRNSSGSAPVEQEESAEEASSSSDDRNGAAPGASHNRGESAEDSSSDEEAPGRGGMNNRNIREENDDESENSTSSSSSPQNPPEDEQHSAQLQNQLLRQRNRSSSREKSQSDEPPVKRRRTRAAKTRANEAIAAAFRARAKPKAQPGRQNALPKRGPGGRFLPKEQGETGGVAAPVKKDKKRGGALSAAGGASKEKAKAKPNSPQVVEQKRSRFSWAGAHNLQNAMLEQNNQENEDPRIAQIRQAQQLQHMQAPQHHQKQHALLLPRPEVVGNIGKMNPGQHYPIRDRSPSIAASDSSIPELDHLAGEAPLGREKSSSSSGTPPLPKLQERVFGSVPPVHQDPLPGQQFLLPREHQGGRSLNPAEQNFPGARPTSAAAVSGLLHNDRLIYHQPDAFSPTGFPQAGFVPQQHIKQDGAYQDEESSSSDSEAGGKSESDNAEHQPESLPEQKLPPKQAAGKEAQGQRTRERKMSSAPKQAGVPKIEPAVKATAQPKTHPGTKAAQNNKMKAEAQPKPKLHVAGGSRPAGKGKIKPDHVEREVESSSDSEMDSKSSSAEVNDEVERLRQKNKGTSKAKLKTVAPDEKQKGPSSKKHQDEQKKILKPSKKQDHLHQSADDKNSGALQAYNQLRIEVDTFISDMQIHMDIQNVDDELGSQHLLTTDESTTEATALLEAAKKKWRDVHPDRLCRRLPDLGEEEKKALSDKSALLRDLYEKLDKEIKNVKARFTESAAAGRRFENAAVTTAKNAGQRDESRPSSSSSSGVNNPGPNPSEDTKTADKPDFGIISVAVIEKSRSKDTTSANSKKKSSSAKNNKTRRVFQFTWPPLPEAFNRVKVHIAIPPKFVDDSMLGPFTEERGFDTKTLSSTELASWEFCADDFKEDVKEDLFKADEVRFEFDAFTAKDTESGRHGFVRVPKNKMRFLKNKK
ncbi:unnamed protein product [Amoebophrya sp. A120]|nr:unnamed protein product [Amoebophrya sp. A120]|eukprot:GSA120T00018853001.1